MRGILSTCTLLVLSAAVNSAAQAKPPDFSGRWVLTDAPSETETLAITVPDELAITQIPLAVAIEHPAKPGTHPQSGTFRFVIGGTISSDGSETRSGVSWVGYQLIISSSTTSPPDARGVRVTVGYGAIWSLDRDGRLVIEFGENRTGTTPKTATRVYIRPPQRAIPR